MQMYLIHSVGPETLNTSYSHTHSPYSFRAILCFIFNSLTYSFTQQIIIITYYESNTVLWGYSSEQKEKILTSMELTIFSESDRIMHKINK